MAIKVASRFAALTIMASSLVPAVLGQSASCPIDGPLSCQNTTAVANTCCFNAPGGSMLQTQFWDYNPSTGPVDSWTIHGLWPDHCDGTYDANCDSQRAYTNITQILQASGKTETLSYMQTYWKDYQGDDESFWEHEWGKHGTCISTLRPSCYTNYQPTQEVGDFFDRTVALFKTLNSYQFLKDAGIIPDSSKKYQFSDVLAALAKGHDGKTPVVNCKNGAINEVWYYFNVRGSVQTGDFVSVAKDAGGNSNCPSTVSYIPKTGGSPSPTSTRASSTTAGSTSTPTSGGGGTGAPFSGKGFLNVVNGGKQNGCIISNGKWYTTGTCATYTATGSGSGFTLKGSKGSCVVGTGGVLDCTSTGSGTVFTASAASNLAYQGVDQFYADAVAQGSTQQSVYTQQKSQTLTITWSSSG